jgi:hypothetical protein
VNGISAYEIRELRLASLRGDGALVPLLELVEDVAHETETGDLFDVLEQIKEMKEQKEGHEKEVDDLLSATCCSSLEEVAEDREDNVKALAEAERERDEQRDALHRLQGAVTKIAREDGCGGASLTGQALLAAVAASDDGTPEALRGHEEPWHSQTTYEKQRAEIFALGVKVAGLEAELAASKKRTRKPRKVTP